MKLGITTGIIFDLLSKKSVTATYLANKYEVTTRTIYRYLDEITVAGIPIETYRGAGGGIKIRDEFKISSSFLTFSEYEVVINSLKAIFNEVKSEVLESAINKLLSAKRGYSAVNVKTGNLVIDAGAWCDSASHKDKLIVVNNAMDKLKVISFDYYDRNGEKSVRSAEPHTLIFKEGMWYVYAYCLKRNDFRFFKIGRMANIVESEESFSRREVPENLPFDTWYENSSLVSVVLRVEDESLPQVEEWLGVENIVKEGDHYIATAKLPNENSLIGKILSLGKGVKVVSPTEIKTKIKETIEEIIKTY